MTTDLTAKVRTNGDAKLIIDREGTLAKPVPTPEQQRAAEIAELLADIGRQTPAGDWAWKGFLIGAGLPKGAGSLTVTAAAYEPKPAEPAEPAQQEPT